MDRREALLNLGKGFGFALTATTLSSVLTACQQDPAPEGGWTPTFFTTEQGVLLVKIIDLILPATDTPSASDANVHLFIDGYAAEVLPEEQQKALRETVAEIGRLTTEVSGKEKMNSVTPGDLTPALKMALSGQGGAKLSYGKKLRNLTILGYKCNELVGTEVLAYDPVPGEYIPCADKNELTGGKAWSY